MTEPVAPIDWARQQAAEREQQPARKLLDQMSDAELADLYDRVDVLTGVAASNLRAYMGLVADIRDAQQRAEQAEAALERVTSPAAIHAAALAMSDEALTRLGRDLGTIHIETIAETAIRAALAEPKEPRP